MHPTGLRPHTHEERMVVARALVPRLRDRFGDGLRAVALSGSVARGDDRAFSDLELVVFCAIRRPRTRIRTCSGWWTGCSWRPST